MPEFLRACFLALDDFVSLRRTDSRLESKLWLVDSIGSLVRCLVCGSCDGKWSVEAEWRGGKEANRPSSFNGELFSPVPGVPSSRRNSRRACFRHV
eukprot:1106222-Rhodomonas_salina.1